MVTELRIVHHRGAVPADAIEIGRWERDRTVVVATLGPPPVIDVWWTHAPDAWTADEDWYHREVQPALIERICTLGSIGAALVFEPSQEMLKAMKAHEN